MKERPIIFSGDMVRAILAGRKSQTRRILKPQPIGGDRIIWDRFNGIFQSGQLRDSENACREIRCSYGKPGDRLYVKETWAYIDNSAFGEASYCEYRADTGNAMPGDWPEEHRDDPDCPKWKSSMFMPRWASRITLELTGVRVERLNDISGEDCRAEGVEVPRCGCDVCAMSSAMCPADASVHIEEYRHLWDKIHGAGAWEQNCWVWVLEFKRVEV